MPYITKKSYSKYSYQKTFVATRNNLLLKAQFNSPQQMWAPSMCLTLFWILQTQQWTGYDFCLSEA
jgi:hypothetical protein